MARTSSGERRTRRNFLTFAGSCATAATLAGCLGGGDDNGNGDQDDGNGSDVSNGDDIPQFTWLMTGNLRTLDPARSTDRPTTVATVNFYDNLVTVDENSEVIENVATDWSYEDDGETVVFDLRDDITFHSGNSLTAEDVAYSMNRIVEADIGLSHLWEGIIEPGGVQARDDTTVEFSLAQPYEPLIATLVQFFIVDSEVVQENERDDYGQEFLNFNVAGSGPYQLPDPLESGDPEEVPMVQFEEYKDGWEGNQFERARMQKMEEESTIINLIRNGDAHMTDPVLSVDGYEEMDAFDNARTVQSEQLSVFHIGLHTEMAPTDDPKVREAFAYAFDYSSAIENVFRGGENPPGVVPVNMPGHNDDLETITQDLDRAQQALEESSYTVEEINDIGVEHVHVAEIERQRNVGLLFQNSLSELGIEVDVNALTWAQMVERVSNSETTPTAINMIFSSEYPSPDSFLYGPYHPSNSSSWQYVSWLEGDDLIDTLESARTTVDQDEAAELYKEAQEMVYDQYPGIYIVNQPLRVALNANVEGYTYKGVSGFDGRIYDMHWSA
ncbi:ABC transporter substrate-binding protein [Natrialbaceae archaeon A-CW2]